MTLRITIEAIRRVRVGVRFLDRNREVDVGTIGAARRAAPRGARGVVLARLRAHVRRDAGVIDARRLAPDEAGQAGVGTVVAARRCRHLASDRCPPQRSLRIRRGARIKST